MFTVLDGKAHIFVHKKDKLLQLSTLLVPTRRAWKEGFQRSR